MLLSSRMEWHYTVIIVREALNREFPDEWIGKAGALAWPLRIPDWTPLDFFILGVHKNIVYTQNIQSMQRLKERIADEIRLCLE